MRGCCEICGRPDYVDCDYVKHADYEKRKRQKEISRPDPEEILA